MSLYIIFRKDRNSLHGGGVVILVGSSIPAVRLAELETNCEIVWVKLLVSASPLLFRVFYRPLDSSLLCLEELNSSFRLPSTSSGIPLSISMFPL